MNSGGGGGPGFDPFGGFKSPFEDMFKNADVRTLSWFSSLIIHLHWKISMVVF